MSRSDQATAPPDSPQRPVGTVIAWGRVGPATDGRLAIGSQDTERSSHSSCEHESSFDSNSGSQPTPGPLFQSRPMVLATLFLVTGVLGVPLLWRSPCFGTIEKWVWTVVVAIYTAVLLAGVVWLLSWSLGRASPMWMGVTSSP